MEIVFHNDFMPSSIGWRGLAVIILCFFSGGEAVALVPSSMICCSS
jgi:hypothetical protein